MNKTQLKQKLETYKLDLFEEEKATSSIDSYYRQAKLFISTIVHDDDISKADIISFKKYIIEILEFQASTTNAYIVGVNKFLYYCDLGDYTVKKLKVQQELVIEEIMLKSDYKRLIKFGKKLEMFDTVLMMKTLALTGVRAYELKYFTFENLSKSMYLSIRNKGKTRTIIIPQDLRREILRYCKENNIKNGYIFHSPKNETKPIIRSTLWRRFKKIAGLARVKKSLIYPHAFRHLFAITYLESGGNPLNLADILGHSSTQTTRIYSKLTQQQLRGTIEKIKY